MQGFCHQCGDCCENIWVDASPDEMLEQLKAISQDVDAGDEPSRWQHNAESYMFILENWQLQNNGRWQCSFFNSQTRKCEAHNLRPPICAGFPFYGRNPQEPGFANTKVLDNKCGYWYDIPRHEWTDEVKLLPIV